MAAVTKNYKVETLDNTVPIATRVDITNFVISLDDFSVQSTGKISTAKITINAEFGAFITQTNGGATPLIATLDRMEITIIDDDGVEKQSKIFEVVTDMAQAALQSGALLPLELEGRERNLSGIPFSGLFRSATHFEMATNIINAYVVQAKVDPVTPGGFQPGFILAIGDTPKFNPNIWDFTQVDNCYDALLSVIESANLPVSAGGGGNRFALIFDDDPTDDTLIDVTIIKQGTRNDPSPYPVLQQNVAHPIRKADKLHQATTASVVVVRGRPGTGTQPTAVARFPALIQFYNAIKDWDPTVTYPVDSFVTDKGTKFKCLIQNLNQRPPNANWVSIDVGDFIGTFQYSPFTNDKVGPIKNGFANPEGGFDPALFTSIAIPDHNIVIRDKDPNDETIGTNRETALIRTNTTAITADPFLNKYLFNETDFINGTTCLVDLQLGAVGGDFAADNFGTGAGNDPNGRAYGDSIVVFVVPDGSISSAGRWIVQRLASNFDQCAVYSEGRVYEFNVPPVGSQNYPGTGLANARKRGGSGVDFKWRDISGQFMGNDCFHTPLSITTVDGLFGKRLKSGELLNDPAALPYVDKSGLKIVFGFIKTAQDSERQSVWKILWNVLKIGAPLETFIAGLSAAIITTFTTPNYTNMGWWFAWPSPYPLSTHNTIVEEIGELYGGQSNQPLNSHRFFDLFNIRHTTKGFVGWNSSDSNDLSEITGCKFLFNFDITDTAGVRIPFTGDLPFYYWAIDDLGTVWISQKVLYRHLGETQPFAFEFGDLTPTFRTRTPMGISNILENIIAGELETNEVLFKDKILYQGFQWAAGYDDKGRYAPNIYEQIIKPYFFDFFGGGTGNIEFRGIIDAYAFTKAPVAISKTFSGDVNELRAIFPQIEDYQNIVNQEQLQRLADSSKTIEEFEYNQFTVEQGGIADLVLEDSVAFTDPELIDRSEQGANSIILAVREIHYRDMPNEGMVRKLILVEVIE